MAATPLWFVRPGYIDSEGVGKDALDKEMDALVKVANQTVMQGLQFFRTVTTVTDTYKESGYGDDLQLPPRSEDSARMPTGTPSPDYLRELTVVNRRLAVQVERSFTEDQKFDVARKMMGGLLRVGLLSIEYGCADIINNLSTDSAAYRGGDGVPLVDSSHPHRLEEGGTWDNEETAAALTTANLFTMFKNMRKRTDTRGYINPMKPRLVAVPPDMEKKMAEIKSSVLVPENSLNAKNVVPTLGGGWTWMVYDYFTSTTSYLCCADVPADQNGLLYVEKVRPSVAPLEGADKSTDIIWGQRLRMRVAFGGRHGRSIQLNAGA